MRFRYVHEPHPHLVVEEVLPPALYVETQFPDDDVEPGASWGLTSTDARYPEVIARHGWRELHAELTGEPFVRSVIDAFADDMRAAGCLVDPDTARVTRYPESREEKEEEQLAEVGDPNEVFTRFDFQSKAEGGYREFVHLDWARRIVGGILFFSDADEEGQEGGELALFRDRGFANDRWCHDPELTAMFPPRHNTGVIFLNSNAGFHGPRAITKLRGRRRWVYFTISSIVDVWPCEARDPNLRPSGSIRR